MVIHAALLAAVHPQVASAVTATLAFVASHVDSVEDVGEIAGVHAVLNANVSDRALGAVSNGPTALTTAS
jgi:hypothetical protein